MGRQTSVTEGAGSTFRQTQITYDDTNRIVTTRKDKVATGDLLLATSSSYDPLYRVNLTSLFESASDTVGIKTQTRYVYKGNNSYKLVSNPFRAATSAGATAESTMGWTLTTYDQNGRPTASQSLGGTGLPSAFGGSNSNSLGTVGTLYSTNTTTVTDAAGHQRASTADALGRISSVTEYPGTGSYGTTYSYDALSDLTRVKQSSQTRTFVYDSLKRLIASTNPETYSASNPAALGCVNGIASYANCYYYDGNGNLTQKTDNRGVGVAYAYDALNRVQTKTYNNVPKTVSILAVNYTYDQASVNYSRGRLTSVATTTKATSAGDTSTTNYLGYDPLGRVLASSQTTNGNTYTFSYRYDLNDDLTSETYPSGRVVSTCYDGASRVSQVGLSSCGNTNSTYASNFQYATNGQPTQYVFGNKVWHSPTYNGRLQMSGFSDLLNNSPSTTLLSAALTWGTSANNGNLLGATYNHGGPGYAQSLTFTQTFGYDGVNRLTTASDTGGWSRSLSYDAYGNMTPAGTPPPPTESFNSNNQITAQPYDQAGNLQSVGGNSLQYDYENRLISETDGVNNAVETYVFDGDGRRVEKYSTNNTRTVFVYDAMGRMAAEYAMASETPSCITCYLSVDHLGTPRLVTDQSGLVVARHDYLPFGEEVAANTYGRDSHWGTAGDSINQKFTGKERDSESGLDYFGARYYGSALGRFTSVDPENAGSDPSNPQSWNGYAYTVNNPLNAIDPSGLDCITTTDQTSSSVTVTTERGGSASTCNGTYVDGTVDTNSFSYNGSSLGYSFSNASAAGAGTISFGSSNSDISPFGLAVVQSVGRQTNSMYGLMGTFAGGSLLAGGGLAASGALDLLATLPEDYSVLGPHRAFNLLSKVSDSKLRNIIKALYRVTAKIGDGGTADSVAYTRETGNLVGGSTHVQKALDLARGLQNVLSNPNLAAGDREIAKALLSELQNAVK